MVLGGPRSGKTTLVKALIRKCNMRRVAVLTQSPQEWDINLSVTLVSQRTDKESVMNTIRKRAIKYAKEENDHYLVVDDNTVVREGSHRLHNLVDNVPSDMGLIIASSVIPSKDILCELDYCFILGKSSVLALLGSSIPNVGTMRSYESLVIDSKAVCMGVYKAMLPTSA